MEISQPFRSCKMSVLGCEMALMCQRVVLQLRNTLRNGGTTAKSKKFLLWLCAVHLQMAITSSFQIQIVHRLKRWTPDFPSFKMRYSMHNFSSRYYFKNVSNSVAKCNISVHGVHSHLQTAITSSFQLQIMHRLKLWTPDFPSFETKYGMHEMNFGK